MSSNSVIKERFLCSLWRLWLVQRCQMKIQLTFALVQDPEISQISEQGNTIVSSPIGLLISIEITSRGTIQGSKWCLSILGYEPSINWFCLNLFTPIAPNWITQWLCMTALKTRVPFVFAFWKEENSYTFLTRWGLHGQLTKFFWISCLIKNSFWKLKGCSKNLRQVQVAFFCV